MDTHMPLSQSNTGICKFHLKTLNKLESSSLKSFRGEVFVSMNYMRTE